MSSLPVERLAAAHDPWTVRGVPVHRADPAPSSTEWIAADTAHHAPRSAAGWPTRLGRQPIVTSDGRTIGYEFLYRAPSRRPVRVDRWTPARQTEATSAVLDSVFGGSGVASVAADRLAFVNVTRSYLVGELSLPYDPARLVLEIVESVEADPAVIAGVKALRARGYRIAIDDFVGLDDQIALLPHADYVKLDIRDLALQGASLIRLAARFGAALVAERVEDKSTLDRCAAAGFTLFQGNVVQPTIVFERIHSVPSPRTR
ncbi:MAG: EAL and HDOD domain-containing protein [Cellulomonas sp.]